MFTTFRKNILFIKNLNILNEYLFIYKLDKNMFLLEILNKSIIFNLNNKQIL